MQVTSLSHERTHAVIASPHARVHTARVAMTPQFFEVLSSTLYSNKELAVVREVLCNAWDAHLILKKDRVPIRVTITESEMVVEDRGPGIPHAEVPDTYLTYGGGTKDDDPTQTGGFGLGAKAPFAITKNFSVVSTHDGIRGIYNVSRGTGASAGIPDIRQVVAVPCPPDETGFRVSIPLTGSKQAELLRHLVEAVAYTGDILVETNWSRRPLSRIPYAKIQEAGIPFALVINHAIPEYMRSAENPFYVRYGSVVYPISEHFISHNIKGKPISAFRSAGRMVGSTYAVIFEAPPNSLTVVPSREALEYTDRTKETIRSLVKRADRWIQDHEPKAISWWIARFREMQNSLAGSPDLDLLHMLGRSENLSLKKRISDLCIPSPTIPTHRDTVVDSGALVQFLGFKLSRETGVLDRAVEELIRQDPANRTVHQIVRRSLRRRWPSRWARTRLQQAENRYRRKHAESNYYTGYQQELVHLFQHQVLRDIHHLGERIQKRFGHTVEIALSTDDRGLSRISSEIREGINLGFLWFSGNYDRKGVKVSPFTRNIYDNTGTLKILADVLKNPLGLASIPFRLANSKVAFQRWEEAHLSKETRAQSTGLHWKVICRSKADYPEVLDFLKTAFHPKTEVLDIGARDRKPLRIASDRPWWRLVRGEESGTWLVVPDELRASRCYIMMPRQGMIPGLKGKDVEAKLNLDGEILDALLYLYGNILVVPYLDQARFLEKEGIPSVLQLVARDAQDWFEQLDKEDLLSFAQSIGHLYHSPGLAHAMDLMTPARLLEALGLEPTYKPFTGTRPTVVEVFLKLLNSHLAHRYGMQHLRQVGIDLVPRFKDRFGTDLDLLEDRGLVEIFNQFPRSLVKERKMNPMLLTAALQAVIQQARLQRVLGASSA